MLKVYRNHILSIFNETSPLIKELPVDIINNMDSDFNTNNYLLFYENDTDSMILVKSIKSNRMYLYGSVKLVPYAVGEIISLGISFEEYEMSNELSVVFDKYYKKHLKGSFDVLYQDDKKVIKKYLSDNIQTVVLAGGCFWCMAKPYYEYDGIVHVYSGYSGGSEIFPKYEQVKGQNTTHKECVKLVYDKSIISLKSILDIYFDVIDPFDDEGQFIDRGDSYTTAMYYHNENDYLIMKEYLKKQEEKYHQKVVVKLLKEQIFYKAEEFHQDYSIKNKKEMEEEMSSSGRLIDDDYYLKISTMSYKTDEIVNNNMATSNLEYKLQEGLIFKFDYQNTLDEEDFCIVKKVKKIKDSLIVIINLPKRKEDIILTSIEEYKHQHTNKYVSFYENKESYYCYFINIIKKQ